MSTLVHRYQRQHLSERDTIEEVGVVSWEDSLDGIDIIVGSQDALEEGSEHRRWAEGSQRHRWWQGMCLPNCFIVAWRVVGVF